MATFPWRRSRKGSSCETKRKEDADTFSFLLFSLLLSKRGPFRLLCLTGVTKGSV